MRRAGLAALLVALAPSCTCSESPRAAPPPAASPPRLASAPIPLHSARAEAARLLARAAGSASPAAAGSAAAVRIPSDCSTEGCRLSACSKACAEWMANSAEVRSLDSEGRKRVQFDCLGGCLEAAARGPEPR